MGLDLSFILVNWNTRESISEALRSIFHHTDHGYSFEVVVVDNGSNDNSPEAIKTSFPQIHLIANVENRGFAQAVNQALAEIKGRYVFLLNSDARLTKGAIGVLVSFMDDNPDVGIAGGQLLNADGSRQNSIAPFPSLTTELLNKRLLRTLFPLKYPGKERDYPAPVDANSLVGAGIIVRRRAIEEIGELDEGYFLFMEETDWCFRMRQKGWRVCFVPHAQIIHLQGASAAMARAEAKIEFYRSRYRFFAKWRGKTATTLLRWGLMLRLLVEVTANSLLIGTRKHRDRWRTSCQLLRWHVRSCPPHEGLKGVKYVAEIDQNH